ncbi:hypothetical protein [Streptomyces niveus]|uniref:hypothetical protein n=1 Tax=Streptomyces niveus TaxID=193462 RepID=UPI0003C5AAEF|nr:hypothetical protein [Streptomyces niveus]EST22811.1 hypothetical protein M877_28965 [Streptomyces niveus NCIMB 11891]
MNPDLAPYVGAVAVIGAAAVTWAARLFPAPARPVEDKPAAAVDELWLACHTTRCAHMTTRHDRTPAGLVCRSCGNVTEVQP